MFFEYLTKPFIFDVSYIDVPVELFPIDKEVFEATGDIEFIPVRPV
jgi:hypothetical protein